MLLLIVGLIFLGLVVGALGRLIVPGPNPIGFFGTVLVGLVGSFLGGLVTRYALHAGYAISAVGAFIIAVLFTALLVALFSPGRMRRSRI